VVEQKACNATARRSLLNRQFSNPAKKTGWVVIGDGRGEGDIMLDALSQAELYHDLSDEYYNVASATDISIECRNRYVRMAEHYDALAEAEEHLALARASGC
jgi:hypothetical protein